MHLWWKPKYGHPKLYFCCQHTFILAFMEKYDVGMIMKHILDIFVWFVVWLNVWICLDNENWINLEVESCQINNNKTP